LNLRVKLNFINKLKTKDRYTKKILSLCKKIAVGGGFEPPTVQLASIQCLVVNPSRYQVPALYRVYPLSPPPRQEGMATKFHHPTVWKRSLSLPLVLSFFDV